MGRPGWYQQHGITPHHIIASLHINCNASRMRDGQTWWDKSRAKHASCSGPLCYTNSFYAAIRVVPSIFTALTWSWWPNLKELCHQLKRRHRPVVRPHLRRFRTKWSPQMIWRYILDPRLCRRHRSHFGSKTIPTHPSGATRTWILWSSLLSMFNSPFSESSTASVSASILEYRRSQGRTYHSDKFTTNYFFPNDDQQVESMDLTYGLLLRAIVKRF
jgi:hypothetical protein